MTFTNYGTGGFYPWIIADNGGGIGKSFAALTAGVVRPLVAADYVNTLPTTATSSNIRLLANASVTGTAGSMNALVVESGNLTFPANSQITVSGGGILTKTTGTTSFTGAGSTSVLAGPNGEMVLSIYGDTTLDNLTLTPSSGNNQLTITGNKTLTLTNSVTNAYASTVSLNGATLAIGSNSGLANSTGALISSGGTVKATASFTATRLIYLNPGGLTFDTNGFDLTLTQPIYDNYGPAGPLVKTGAGTLFLNSTNGSNYAGGTVLAGGTLAVPFDNALGSSSGALTFQGGTLLFVNSTSISRSTVLATNGTMDTGTTTSLVSSLISGPGGLIKTGSGTLTLSNSSNSYAGGTTVNGGILVVSADGNLGAVGSTLTLNGGTLRLGGTLVATRPVTLTALNGTVENSNNNGAIAGVISGAGSLIKTGINTLTLSNTNSYQGGTFFNAGTLVASADASLGNVNGGLTFNGGGLRFGAAFSPAATRTITLPGSGTLDTNGFNVTLLQGISGAGGLTKTGGGVLTPMSVNTYAGGTTISGGTLDVGVDTALGNAAGGITLSGGTLRFTAAFNPPTARAVSISNGTFDTNGFNVTLAQNVSGGGTLNKSGAGTLTLSGSNAYSALNINGGTLKLNANGSLPSNSNVSVNAILDLNGFNASVGYLSGSGTINTNGGNLSVANGDWSGTIAGSGSLTVTNSNLFLYAANTYTGTTQINGGVFLYAANSLPAGTTLALNGTLTTNGNSFTIGALSGSGAIILSNGASLTLGAASGTSTFAGSIQNSIGGLIKVGAGEQILNGANTYTGQTRVDAGRLVLGGASASTDFLVNTTGTLRLGGTFTLSTGSILANSGGVVEYQNSTVNGGFLRGPGSHTIMASATATFNGITTFTSTAMVGSGNTFFNNVIHGGSLTSAAGQTFTWSGGQINAAGRVTVNGTAAFTDVESIGQLTIAPGATLNSTVSDLVLGGGSTTFVGTAGNFAAATVNLGGLNLNLRGGLLVNNGGDAASGGGVRNGTVVIDYGGKAKGTGYYEDYVTRNGGVYSPGNSPGTGKAGTSRFNDGGILNIDVNAAGPDGTPPAGVSGGPNGWSRVDVSTALRAYATSGSHFAITLTSLTTGNQAGPVYNFVGTGSYKWEVVRLLPGAIFTTSETGLTPASPSAYDASVVDVLTAGSFSNALAGGGFFTTFEPNGTGTYSVFVNYSPLPEPALLGVLAAGLLSLRRWRQTHSSSIRN